MIKDKGSKLEWGALSEKIPTDLLDLTDISYFIGQEYIDQFTAALKASKGGRVSMASKDNEVNFYLNTYSVSGDNKYDYHIKTKDGAKVFPPNSDKCGQHTVSHIIGHAGANYLSIHNQIVNNKYGTWKSCQISVVSPSTPQSTYKHVFLDPELLIVQDYDGSVKFFKGRLCMVSFVAKRHGLAKLMQQKSPINLLSQEREEQ